MRRKPKRRTCADRQKFKRIKNLRLWRDCAKRVLTAEGLIRGLEILGSARACQTPGESVVYYTLPNGAEFIGTGANPRSAARDVIRQSYKYLSKILRIDGPHRRAKTKEIEEIYRPCRKA